MSRNINGNSKPSRNRGDDGYSSCKNEGFEILGKAPVEDKPEWEAPYFHKEKRIGLVSIDL